MGFHRIAVSTDGSETAAAAVGVAVDLAQRYGAELLVIAVAPLPPVFAGPTEPMVPATIPASAVPYYRDVAEKVVAQAKAAGVKTVRSVCQEGAVVEEILRQVKENATDLLVVGSRGLSAAGRLLLGSVSTAVVTHAPCPVLVVRPATTR